MNSGAILKFALNHWKELLMCALLAIVVGKFRYDYKQLEAAYEATQQSLEEQLAGLQEIHKRELERREAALSDYRDALADLERNYIESQVELERQKQVNRRKHIDDFSGNKEKLIKDIQEAYGFTHVP